jgi:hypothetical protein
VSIKFVCTCGKHLRARDAMASRRSVCPRCGAPVGVPSLGPTHRGAPAAAPLSPQERVRLAQQRLRPGDAAPADGIQTAAAVVGVTATAPPPAGAPAVAAPPADEAVVVRGPRRRREARWYHCLLYACRAWLLLLALAAALTTLTGSAALSLRDFDDLRAHPWQAALFGWIGGVLTGAVLGYVFGFLDCTLAGAAAGEVKRVRWPGNDLGLAFRSLVRWAFAFVTGPVLGAAAAFFYWLHGGDLTPLDEVILAELGVLTLGSWALAVAAAGRRDRTLDATPWRAAELAYRLGPRTLLVLVAADGLLAHGWLLLASVEALHRSPVGGALGLLVSWGSALFLATVLFRLLGVWCHRLDAAAPCPGPVSPPQAGRGDGPAGAKRDPDGALRAAT